MDNLNVCVFWRELDMTGLLWEMHKDCRSLQERRHKCHCIDI